MPSYTSPPRPYHDRETSPSTISPLTPLSPSSLPHWLRAGRSKPSPRNSAAGGKLKILILAAACLALGWTFTSTLAPGEDGRGEQRVVMTRPSLDNVGSEVLEDPSGFGRRPGIISMDEEGFEDGGLMGVDEGEEEGGKEEGKSVTGALAELHSAVSHKIQSWNPYFAKGGVKGGGRNDTEGSNGARKKGKNNHQDSKNSITPLGGEDIKDGIPEPDRLGARTRIGKATVLFSGNAFWERCIRTHERHDKVHGYRLHILRQQLVDDVWSKPAYILSLLLREMSKPESERLDWLFWVDADTVILNPNVPIETFLPPPGTEFDDIHLMYSHDWNGLNNGVFPVRVNQWAVRLFSGIVAFRQFKPDADLTFRDQSAMSALFQEPEYSKHIIQAPQRWFNAYQGEHNETLQPFQVRRGDLLVHFAGVPAREERMQFWLERAEQRLDDWEVPVKSTSYPAEARAFWEEERAKRRARKAQVLAVRTKALELMQTTDGRMAEYGERLGDEARKGIEEGREKLQAVFEDASAHDDVEKIQRAIDDLEQALSALTDAVTKSNKSLLKSAHEAIFAAEKDMLENEHHDGIPDPDLQQISTTVSALKSLVIKPESEWNRHEIVSATEAVAEARAKLSERLQAAEAQRKEKQSQAKALQAEKLMAEEEASGGGGRHPGHHSQVMGEGEEGSGAAHSGHHGQSVGLGHNAQIDEDDGNGDSNTDAAETTAAVDQVVSSPTAVEDAQPALPTLIASEVEVIGVTVTAAGPVAWVTRVVTTEGQDVDLDPAKGDLGA